MGLGCSTPTSFMPVDIHFFFFAIRCTFILPISLFYSLHHSQLPLQTRAVEPCLGTLKLADCDEKLSANYETGYFLLK